MGKLTSALVGLIAILVGGAGLVIPSAAATPRPDHVVIAIMENHAYSQIIGNTSAPYINGLAQQNALMTQSFGIGHPSEPNYLELWSGSNQGVTDDSCPHTFSTGSIGQQMLDAGLPFATYSESMPSDGYLGCNSGTYARKHNPGANWVVSQDAAHNKTYNAWPSDFTTLPTFSLVVPNLCNDMHDCSVGTGDAWLQTHFDPYVQWAKTHNSLAILTWDEDNNSSGNHIATILAGAGVTPGQYSEHITHYNVLRTIENFYGLTPLAGAASVAPITDVFGGPLPSPSPSPSSSPIPTPTPSPSPTGSCNLATPIRASFYYPWYPENWTQGATYPATRYHPWLGIYSLDAQSLAVERAQITEMEYGHLQAGISSWWGQGTQTDGRVAGLLQAANGTPFCWTFYYEPAVTGGASQIAGDLAYISAHYASNPSFLHVNGKPALFVYSRAEATCAAAQTWVQTNNGQFYLNLQVFGGYASCAVQPDNWHQYGPAVAEDHQTGHSFSISPGFYKYNEAAPRLARDPLRWTQNVADMKASNEPWQLVTTFNEWLEGTSAENALEWQSPSGQGVYLDALHG